MGGNRPAERDPVSGSERDVSIPDFGDGAVPVPFHFKNPVRVIEGFLDQGREHRFYCLRHRFHRRCTQLLRFQRLPEADLIQLLLPGALLRIGFGDILQGLAGDHGAVLLEDVLRGRMAILLLQKEPGLLVLSRFYQREFTLKLFPLEDELQIPFFQSLPKKPLALFAVSGGRVMVNAPVPDDHAPRAVIVLRDETLKILVIERVIFDHHGQPFYGWIERGPPRDGPALQHALQFEPEVVMKGPGRVLLNDKDETVSLYGECPVSVPAFSRISVLIRNG